MQLGLTNDEFAPISPLQEMGAYEALWDEQGATFKTIADKFGKHPGSVPSDFVSPAIATHYRDDALRIIQDRNVGQFGIRLLGAAEYPGGLRDARHPVEQLYYQGWWDLVESPCVAIEGSRKVSPEGVRWASKMAGLLVRADYTVASGLAAGIDAAAHTGALKAGGRTMADLQAEMDHLVRYHQWEQECRAELKAEAKRQAAQRRRDNRYRPNRELAIKLSRAFSAAA